MQPMELDELMQTRTAEAEAIRSRIQREMRCACPGIVQAYHPETQTVDVLPAIRDRFGNESVDLPLLTDIPVFFPGGSQTALTFPVTQGDEALIVFADRCIDGWFQSGGIQNPAVQRAHDLSDGFAFVGFRSRKNMLKNFPNQPSFFGQTGVGADGKDGENAYQIAVRNGFSGTESEWLTTLRGKDGARGEKGDTGKTGAAGKDGKAGIDGQPGLNGKDGKSAYEIAVKNGFAGTETEWLASLKGTADLKDIVVGNYESSIPLFMTPFYRRLSSNRLAYIPPECIVWERTTDGGVTWTAKTVSDADKQKFFLDGADDAFIFPKNNDVPTSDCGLRLNISLYRYNYPTAVTDADRMQYWMKELRTSNSHLYCQLQHFYINSASSSGIRVTLEGRKGGTFSELANGTVRGWSDVGLISAKEVATCGGSKTANYYDILRFTFFLNPNEKNANVRLYNIHGFGKMCFLGNQQATNGVPYTLLPNKKTAFHGDVYALSFNGHQLNKDVPADAKFTDTTYSIASPDTNGLMSADDKKKLDGMITSINEMQPSDNKITLGAGDIKSSSGKTVEELLHDLMFVHDLTGKVIRNTVPQTITLSRAGKLVTLVMKTEQRKWSSGNLIITLPPEAYPTGQIDVPVVLGAAGQGIFRITMDGKCTVATISDTTNAKSMFVTVSYIAAN